MAKTQPLAVELPRIDGGTQSRIKIDEDVVQDYVALITESKEWPFPPLDVFHDGTDYFVADGFHRLLGARRTKRGSIPCHIHEGTARDARIFGMTANDKHGLRMTRADKRACVEWLLDNGGKLTQKEIAEKAGVTVRTVQTIVAERKPKTPPQSPATSGGENTQTSGHSGGDVDPFDDTEDPFGEDGGTDSDGTDTQEPSHRPPRKGKGAPAGPPKQYDRSAWFKQWEQAIGPVVRLVDKIAGEVGERHDPHQEAIQRALNAATEDMAEWMGVSDG